MAIDMTHIINMDIDAVMNVISDANNLNTPEGRELLDAVLNQGYDLLSKGGYDRDFVDKFTEISNDLANKGVSAAIAHYTEHLKLDNWKKQSDGTRVFTLIDKITEPALRNEIVKDLTQEFGLVSKEDVQQTEGGNHIAAIHASTPERAQALEYELVNNEAIQSALGLCAQALNVQSPEQLISLLKGVGKLAQLTAPELLSLAKNSLGLAWKSSIDTIDSIITKVAEAGSVEDMGRVACEQLLLSPLTLLNSSLNQLDAMILAWAKSGSKDAKGSAGKDAHGGAAGSGGAAKKGADPITSPTGTPDGTPDGPEPLSEEQKFRRDILNITRLNQISRFHSQYLNALAAANTPEKRKLFDELRPVFADDNMTHEKLAAEHPDLVARFHADLPETLANPENAKLKELFMNMDIFPEELRNKVAQQIEAISAARTGDHKDKEPKPTEPHTPPKAPADVRALTEKINSSTPKADIIAALQEDLNKRSAEASLAPHLHEAWKDALERVNNAARSLSSSDPKTTSSSWDAEHKHWSHIAQTNSKKGHHLFGTELCTEPQTITKWRQTDDGTRETFSLMLESKQMIHTTPDNKQTIVDLSKKPPIQITSKDGKETPLSAKQAQQWKRKFDSYQKKYQTAVTRKGNDMDMASVLLATSEKARGAFTNLIGLTTDKGR